MAADTVLPWHQQTWKGLMQLARTGRLGHAWLLSGAAGSGKLHFARHLARRLLCQQPEGDMACGRCNSCRWFTSGAHPDWLLLQPAKRLIVVDQVREAIDFASNTSQRGGYKLLCIEPADAMNLSAANALLKLLEEPPAGTVLLLVSAQPGQLLPTLRSRCQHLKLALPTVQQALDWLAAEGCGADAQRLLCKAGGAPLRALALGQSGVLAEHETVLLCVQDVLAGKIAPVQAARKCEKIGIVSIMEALLETTRELIMHLQAAQPLADSQLQPLASQLQQRGPGSAAVLLHDLHASFERSRQTALATNNANALLMLEQVFGEWLQLRRQLVPARPARQSAP